MTPSKRRNPGRTCRVVQPKHQTSSDSEDHVQAEPSHLRRKRKAKLAPRDEVKDASISSSSDGKNSDSDFEVKKEDKTQEAEEDNHQPEDDVHRDISLRKVSRYSRSTKRMKRPTVQQESTGEHGTGTRMESGGQSGFSAKQQQLLDEVFKVLDRRGNDRIALSDLMRVADDHGIVYSHEEARDMMRFWDSSGTITISKDSFLELAVESKFVVPSRK